MPMTEQWAKCLPLLNTEPHGQQLTGIYQNRTNFTLIFRHYMDESFEADSRWLTVDTSDPSMEMVTQSLLNSAVTRIREAAVNQTDEIARNQMNHCANCLEHPSIDSLTLVATVKDCLHRERILLDQIDQMQHTANQNSPETSLPEEEAASASENPPITHNQGQPLTSSEVDYLLLNVENFLRKTDRDTQNLCTLFDERESKVAEQQNNRQCLTAAENDKIPLKSAQALGGAQSGNEIMDYLRDRVNVCAEAIKTIENNINEGCADSLNGLKRVKSYLSSNVLPRIIEAKQQWTDRVRAHANGYFQDTGIQYLEDLLHRTCAAEVLLFTVVSKLHRKMEKYPSAEPILIQLKKDTYELLKETVRHSLLVEHHPPQVLKTSTKFCATVRLASGSALHLHQISPTVRTVILNENQLTRFVAEETWRFPEERSSRSGSMTGDKGHLECAPGGANSLVATLSTLKLSKIDRGHDRRGAALEEKFCIMFHTKFTASIVEDQLEFVAWTTSLPLVAVVHDLQKCTAEGPILWDNAFGVPGRKGFEIRPQVTWRELAFHLQQKFLSMTRIGEKQRALSKNQIAFLARKIFNSSQQGAQVSGFYDDRPVSYDMLLKTSLPGRNFCFWEWFWNAAKTIKDEVREEWADGLIEGFIEKSEVERLLSASNVRVGTFIIRFVDSQTGRICIHHTAVREASHHDMDSLHGPGTLYVKHPEPYTRTELGQKALSLRIRDSPLLFNLYPDEPKMRIFQSHIEREADKLKRRNPAVDGYEQRRDLDLTSENSAQEVMLMVTYMAGLSSFPSSPQQNAMMDNDEMLDIIDTLEAQTNGTESMQEEANGENSLPPIDTFSAAGSPIEDAIASPTWGKIH